MLSRRAVIAAVAVCLVWIQRQHDGCTHTVCPSMPAKRPCIAIRSQQDPHAHAVPHPSINSECVSHSSLVSESVVGVLTRVHVWWQLQGASASPSGPPVARSPSQLNLRGGSRTTPEASPAQVHIHEADYRQPALNRPDRHPPSWWLTQGATDRPSP